MNDQLQDQTLRFGGGSDVTTITIGTLIFVVVTILLLFLLPKRRAVIPYLFVSLVIPYSQVIVVAGLHFNVYRIMLPFAWLRVLMGRNEEDHEKFRLNGIDKAVLLWAFTDAICASLQWGNMGAAINRLGFLYNVLGIYFLLRMMVRSREDVERVLKTFAVACVILSLFMINEQITGRNLFSVFGGVPLMTYVRVGKLRSMAVFAHPIVAGTVGANLLPLFIGLWWQKGKSKTLAGAGAVAAMVMTATASSATPIGAAAAAIAGLCMWPWRHRMKAFRWAIAICLVGLHLAMKAPVWALIQRINIVGGNSGYHRYELVNQAILHFRDWWLVGYQNPSSWGFEMGDVSNAYVAAAVEGGFFTLLFFLAIFWQCFRNLGLARAAAERAQDRKLELQIWAFGAALTATMAAYFGITYFDQSSLIWWSLLAMIGAISSAALAAAPAAEPAVAGAGTPFWKRNPVPLGATAAAGAPVNAAAPTPKRVGPPGFAASRARLLESYRQR